MTQEVFVGRAQLAFFNIYNTLLPALPEVTT